MAPRVAIVIPYYQKNPGVLRRALSSIASQNRREPYEAEVIVVDDQSPVPAKPELDQSSLNGHVEIRVIRQRNKGPAGARNTGLDAVRPDTDFVAFLDSDDEWMPDHIDNALRALGTTCDFYFSDFFQLDQNVTAFNRAGKIKPSEHPPITGYASLHRYQGDMIAQIITGNVIGTSTVVFRRNAFSDLRFREELVNAGEDYMFWLDVTSRTNRIGFSATAECRYGRGVNVYSGATWGTNESLKRIRYDIQYRKTIMREFDVTPSQIGFIKDKIAQLRLEFASEVLHRVHHMKPLPLSQIRATASVDPLSVWGLPLWLLKVIIGARR